MKAVKINVSKIDKTALFEGKNGKYLDLVLWENRDGADQYGNDGFVTQDIGKARREAGEKGPIIGNWKELGDMRKATNPSPNQQKPLNPVGDEEDIPF